jgi:DNA-binding MarR family transcriptional regulator
VKAVVVAAERLSSAIEARATALMLQLGLPLAQLRAVMALRRLGRANGRQLTKLLDLTPGAIVAICDHLEERGYLRRVADAQDRRITWFALTEDGLARLRPPRATQVAKSRTKVLIARLTTSERAGFVKIATAFADALASLNKSDLSEPPAFETVTR